MVSRARTTDRRALPRDEHVARGIAAAEASSHAPYEYRLKYKSGTSRTQTTSIHAKNRLDMFAQLICNHAEEGRDFFVWNVSRALRYQSKAKDY